MKMIKLELSVRDVCALRDLLCFIASIPGVSNGKVEDANRLFHDILR